MKVAIFTDTDFGQVNGVTASLRAALRYAPDGISPRIYTAADLGDDHEDCFAVASVGGRIPFDRETRLYLPRLRRFVNEVRRDGADLIHVTTPGPVGLAAMYVAARTGLPMIGSLHSDLPACAARLSGSTHLATLLRAYLRWLYSRCERILVPSEYLRRQLVAGRLPVVKIGVWMRGVDAQLFSPDKRSSALRERWRVCDRRPAVIYAGRLSREKALGDLRAIQSAIHRRGAEHRLVIVGEGPMRSALQAALPDAIFTGSLPPREAATALASADLFLLPSDTEADGHFVLDAQASGLPVVVSSAGGPGEYIRPFDTGMVCAKGDAEEFGHETARLLRDGARRLAMGQAAREHASTLRWDVALAPLYATYRDAAAARRARLAQAGSAPGPAHGNAAA